MLRVKRKHPLIEAYMYRLFVSSTETVEKSHKRIHDLITTAIILAYSTRD